ERLGGFQIDRQLEFAGLHDRQLGRLGAAEDTPGIQTDLATDFGPAGAVAHQSAGGGEPPPPVGGRDAVAGGQGPRRPAQNLEQGAGAEDDGTGLALNHGRESCIDLGFVRHTENEDFLSHRLGRRLDLPDLERSAHRAGIEDDRDQLGVGHELAQESEALGAERGDEDVHAGGVASRTVEARNKAELDRVAVAALAASADGVSLATSTETRRDTRSAASAGNRSSWPSAKRSSIATF